MFPQGPTQQGEDCVRAGTAQGFAAGASATMLLSIRAVQVPRWTSYSSIQPTGRRAGLEGGGSTA
ncbi:hypothetical protein [Kitasatospora aureofaciens]|uniref:hypothetical protein n=1 Tax=Kitasatospora aureofaciens TaxID=1894 RepID=UPI0033E9B474